jgi:hypothetical protein
MVFRKVVAAAEQGEAGPQIGVRQVMLTTLSGCEDCALSSFSTVNRQWAILGVQVPKSVQESNGLCEYKKLASYSLCSCLLVMGSCPRLLP